MVQASAGPSGLAGVMGGEVYSLPMNAAWLSSRIRSEQLAKPGEAVEVPIKKEALMKVVEYLKYHEEHECSEIRIPLAGDNLQDCGATRWDSSFVNVDRELLFDLTVAASYLDIASLWLLLSAKAALLTNNKSSEKLRKEFAMTSDFPAAEEAALRRDYALSRKASGAAPDADLSMLAASSVVRSSVRQAEYKLGLKQLTDGSDDSKLKSWRHAMWRAAVLDDWKLMQNAPEEVKSDRDLVKSAILTSQGQALKFVSSDLQADEEIVLSAVRHFGTAFGDAAPELRNDKNFLLKALGAHGGAMSGAPDALRNDKAFLLEAAKAGKGAAMQGASLALREDRTFVLDMSVHDAEAYKFAGEELLNDKDFAVAVAKRNGKALKYMLPVFKADPDVVRAAVSRDPQAAQFAHAARRAELGMIQEAIHGEVQLKEELQSQLKAAQEHASTTTALAVAPTGPRQIPAQALPQKSHSTSLKLSKIVQFSAGSTMTANIGQANYCAANAFLDKIPQYQRPELDGVALMWGAVGGIGMRWKAFASEDFLNDVPDALLSIEECGKVLHCTAVYLFPPEWMCSQKYDQQSRAAYLRPTAGQIKLDEASAAAETQLVDQTALQGLPDVDRRPVPGNFTQAPLGGWPSLVSEGAKVKLTNVRAKNGVTGTVVNSDGSGRWKVQLDDGGSVLLRPHFFEVLETTHAVVQKGTNQNMHNSPQVEAFNVQAAAERQWKIEEKRAKLKEKIESYEIFGQMKMGPAGSCPAVLHGKKAKIKCAEGDVFELPADAMALSLRARKDLLENGCEEVLDYPKITKSIMAKLAEYLKHHREHACSEIRTPLASENLVDSGASRWDASFVNVDKETLFDLTAAASYLDIPGLWFLLSAKAAVMTNNKSADKLRKEFSMANDFPAAEEAELRREYAAALKLPDGSDLSQLAASSVIRSGVKAAEYKTAKALEDSAQEVTLKSWRHAMWRAAVLDDWKLLANAPEQVKGDKDLVKSAVLTSQGQALKFAAPELKSDESLVLDATRYSGSAFGDAAPELRNDKNFLLKALGAHGGAMSGAPDALRNDKAFLLEAAKAGKGAAMQGASLALREDRTFVLDMSVHDAEAYKFAAEELLNDKDFAVAVAKRNGKALKYMLPVFKADPDVVRAAVSRDPQAAQFAHAARRAELGMVQEAIHGEVQLKEELQSQLKAAQEDASTTTTLAVAGGPRQVPQQALTGPMSSTYMKLTKTVYFTAMSTMTANMGQANYISANAYMDKIPQYQRPEVDAVGLMWGAVGGIGMRWKAFAENDVLNATPEALLTIPDTSKVLHCACCTIMPPEWFSASHFDEVSRGYYLSETAGKIKLELSQVTASAQTWEKQAEADRKALEDLPTIDRRPVPNNFAAATAPLGGWPSLVKPQSPAVPQMGTSLQKGSKVRLTGLRAKNGVTGILIQQFGDGKWKVKLDDGSGNALLRPGFFEAL